MSASRVLFKIDPSIEVTEHTDMGLAFDLRAPRRPLKHGACLAAFDAGIPYARDIAGPADRAYIVQIEDDELVEAIDRDRALRAAAEREDDAIVIDVEDL